MGGKGKTHPKVSPSLSVRRLVIFQSSVCIKTVLPHLHRTVSPTGSRTGKKRTHHSCILFFPMLPFNGYCRLRGLSTHTKNTSTTKEPARTRRTPGSRRPQFPRPTTQRAHLSQKEQVYSQQQPSLDRHGASHSAWHTHSCTWPNTRSASAARRTGR